MLQVVQYFFCILLEKNNKKSRYLCNGMTDLNKTGKMMQKGAAFFLSLTLIVNKVK